MQGKRLVVCADGTWMAMDSGGLPTNVARMASAVLPTAPDGKVQAVFYDGGVGTGDALDRVLGGAFGIGLDKKIREAYLFLVNNHEPGDEIFLFGFSRGAFTVRSLAGLLRKCGLVRKEHLDKVSEAFEIYRTRDEGPDTDRAARFREQYARPLDAIHFLGVWDTVGALGIPLAGFRRFTHKKYKFHDEKLSRLVRRAYHAVSIDEHRDAFRPTLWRKRDEPDATGQRVEQTWFAGVHSDVGGGYPERGLSDVTLLWMAQRAQQAGLALDETILKQAAPDPMGTLHDSRDSFWSFLPAYWRPIEDDEKYEGVEIAPSALARHAAPLAKYAPPNLVKFLERHGPR